MGHIAIMKCSVTKSPGSRTHIHALWNINPHDKDCKCLDLKEMYSYSWVFEVDQIEVEDTTYCSSTENDRTQTKKPKLFPSKSTIACFRRLVSGLIWTPLNVSMKNCPLRPNISVKLVVPSDACSTFRWAMSCCDTLHVFVLAGQF